MMLQIRLVKKSITIWACLIAGYAGAITTPWKFNGQGRAISYAVS